MSKPCTKTTILTMLATMGVGFTAHAQVWNEVGDAGQNNVAAAQMTDGIGPLTTINGSLNGNNDVDLYCINITDEARFVASVSAYTGNDSMLWLFNMDGTLQVWNDDFSSNFLSMITSQGVFANGHYILGVSSFANIPVDSDGNDLFGFGAWPGPDSDQLLGNSGILAGWNNNGLNSGNYEITLRGCEYCIPAPGAAAVLGLGGLVAAGRRRRTSRSC